MWSSRNLEPGTPENEAERQAAVERYEILDTLPEQSYEDITALMALVCKVPISLIGLIERDRHWLKSHHGIDLDESPRSLSFCGHAIESGEALFTVEDARKDPRFHDNPLVTTHRAIGYAGAPLIDSDGFALGTLCVFSHEPLVLEPAQKDALMGMARQVMYLLERHLRERRLEQTSQELALRNEELRSFAGTVSHDLRAPATNLIELASLIEEDAADVLSEEVRGYLDYMKDSSRALRTYVDGLFMHYTSDDLLNRESESFELHQLFAGLRCLIPPSAHGALVFPDTNEQIRTHRAALQQVLLNLVSNAIKYGTGSSTRVEVKFEQDESGYRFGVSDDGPGIAPEYQESVFKLFQTGESVSRDGTAGTGIGLATVWRLLDRLGGTISLDSELGRGSTFTVTLPRTMASAIAKLAT